ncbi:MAG: VOC family protein [Proteobacteria bacterium]|nr:VOC family protein [Pseudomonadota bacterium]
MTYQFHHIHLLCSNLQNSIDFFTGIPGVTLVARKKFRNTDGATLDLNGMIINLRVARENEIINTDTSHPTYGYHHICVRVENTDIAYKELMDKGFEFIASPVDAGENRIAFFKGPDNIIIEVLQPL